MDIERVRGPDSTPSGKRSKRSVSDEDRFQEEFRVTDVKGIDPDQPKKKRHRAQESEEASSGRVRSNRPQRGDSKPSILDTNFNSRKKDIYGRTDTGKSSSSYGTPYKSHVPSATPPPPDNSQESLPSSFSFWQDNMSNDNQVTPTNTQSPQRAQQQKKTQKKEVHAPKKKEAHDKKHDKKDKSKKTPTAAPAEKKLKTPDAKPTFVSGDAEEEEDDLLAKKGAKEAPVPHHKEEKTDPDKPKKPPKKAFAKKKARKGEDEPVQIPEDWRKEAKAEPAKAPSTPQHEKKKKKEPVHGKTYKSLSQLAQTFAPITPLSDIKDHKPGKEHKVEAHAAPTPIPFSPDAAGAATTATSHVSSYIAPQAQNLFSQMVGTIIVMTNQGISRTEVQLNSPAFQNSPFFGSTILVEKYATAPDSFNIRLTGNTSQVNAFNKNLDGLYNAFERGSFAFKIGRLDASHAPVKPLFKRKKKSGDKDSDFSDQNEE